MKRFLFVSAIIFAFVSSFSFAEANRDFYNNFIYNGSYYMTPLDVKINGELHKTVLLNRSFRRFLNNRNMFSSIDIRDSMLNRIANKQIFDIDSSDIKLFKFNIIKPDADIDSFNVSNIDLLFDKYCKKVESKDSSTTPPTKQTIFIIKRDLPQEKVFCIISKFNDCKLPVYLDLNLGYLVMDTYFPKEVLQLLENKKLLKEKAEKEALQNKTSNTQKK